MIAPHTFPEWLNDWWWSNVRLTVHHNPLDEELLSAPDCNSILEILAKRWAIALLPKAAICPDSNSILDILAKGEHMHSCHKFCERQKESGGKHSPCFWPRTQWSPGTTFTLVSIARQKRWLKWRDFQKWIKWRDFHSNLSGVILKSNLSGVIFKSDRGGLDIKNDQSGMIFMLFHLQNLPEWSTPDSLVSVPHWKDSFDILTNGWACALKQWSALLPRLQQHTHYPRTKVSTCTPWMSCSQSRLRKESHHSDQECAHTKCSIDLQRMI